jgi:hypothetical protein
MDFLADALWALAKGAVLAVILVGVVGLIENNLTGSLTWGRGRDEDPPFDPTTVARIERDQQRRQAAYRRKSGRMRPGTHNPRE